MQLIILSCTLMTGYDPIFHFVAFSHQICKALCCHPVSTLRLSVLNYRETQIVGLQICVLVKFKLLTLILLVLSKCQHWCTVSRLINEFDAATQRVTLTVKLMRATVRGDVVARCHNDRQLIDHFTRHRQQQQNVVDRYRTCYVRQLHSQQHSQCHHTAIVYCTC